jgi:hypothetical protein
MAASALFATAILQPRAQRLDEPFLPLISIGLRRCHGVGWQRRRDCQDESYEQCRVPIVTLFVRSSR